MICVDVLLVMEAYRDGMLMIPRGWNMHAGFPIVAMC